MAEPQTVEDLCPRRGPGLRHHADAVGGYLVCRECGVRLVDPKPSGPPQPFSIVLRLRQLGYNMPEEPLVEPRAITGDGPQGSVRGPGRGALAPRQIKRLEFLAWLRERGRID